MLADSGGGIFRKVDEVFARQLLVGVFSGEEFLILVRSVIGVFEFQSLDFKLQKAQVAVCCGETTG